MGFDTYSQAEIDAAIERYEWLVSRALEELGDAQAELDRWRGMTPETNTNEQE